MDRGDILEYLEMDDEELGSILSGDDPPLAALQAAAVKSFMEDYHLRDRQDALQQFVRFRESQAGLLGLEDEEVERFLEGFRKRRV